MHTQLERAFGTVFCTQYRDRLPRHGAFSPWGHVDVNGCQTQKRPQFSLPNEKEVGKGHLPQGENRISMD